MRFVTAWLLAALIVPGAHAVSWDDPAMDNCEVGAVPCPIVPEGDVLKLTIEETEDSLVYSWHVRDLEEWSMQPDEPYHRLDYILWMHPPGVESQSVVEIGFLGTPNPIGRWYENLDSGEWVEVPMEVDVPNDVARITVEKVLMPAYSTGEAELLGASSYRDGPTPSGSIHDSVDSVFRATFTFTPTPENATSNQTDMDAGGSAQGTDKEAPMEDAWDQSEAAGKKTPLPLFVVPVCLAVAAWARRHS